MLDITTLTAEIKERLTSLGYTTTDADNKSIQFQLNKVEENIKHWCNIDEVPDCLKYVVIERVCGEFLLDKASFNQLDEALVGSLVKSTKIGDTEINYQVGATTPLDILRSQCKNMTSYGKTELIAHRRVSW